MADYEWQGPIEQASLRRALRHALRRFAPGWRVIAEGFLGATTPIDLLAIGDGGELICVRCATEDGGPAPDARLLAQGLSDLGWIAPRIQDLRNLAPELGLSALEKPCSLLVTPHVDSDVGTAVDHLAGVLGAGRLSLVRYRPLRQQGQLALLLEPVKPLTPPPRQPSASPRLEPSGPLLSSQTPAPPPLDSAAPWAPASERLTDPPSPSGFRTGLTDADLRVETPAATH